MSTQTLTDHNISDTYTGLLHSQGAELPTTGQVIVYDGDGNASSLRLGKLGQGASIVGSLSSDYLYAARLAYPQSDGTSGQFITTNGNGVLTFSGVLSTSLPNLSPNPASTYVGVSAISVDSKGRVTNVVTASETGEIYTQQSLYPSPISLVDVTYGINSNINASQTNMPSGTTYAIIQINAHGTFLQGANSGPIYVYINGAVAAMIGSDTFLRQQNIFHNNVSTIWYAALDGSNNFNVSIISQVVGGHQYRVRINLLGYANYNTLSNP